MTTKTIRLLCLSNTMGLFAFKQRSLFISLCWDCVYPAKLYTINGNGYSLQVKYIRKEDFISDMRKKRESKTSSPAEKEASRTFLLAGMSLVVVVVLVVLVFKYAPSQFVGKAIQQQAECIAAPSGIVSSWNMSAFPSTPFPIHIVFDSQGKNPLIWPENFTWKSGPISVVPGKIGQALVFDGVDDFLYRPDTPSLELGAGEFTIEGWIKTDNPNSPQVLVSHFGSYNFLLSFPIFPHCALGDICFFGTGTGKAKADIVANEWTHLAAVRSGSQITFFVNGNLKNGSSNIPPILDSPSLFVVGAAELSPTTFFKGAIDELSIYKRALTAAEIKQIYDAGVKGIGKCALEVSCTDGIDNDGDGNIDCADADCTKSSVILLNATAEYEATIAADTCPGATVSLK